MLFGVHRSLREHGSPNLSILQRLISAVLTLSSLNLVSPQSRHRHVRCWSKLADTVTRLPTAAKISSGRRHLCKPVRHRHVRPPRRRGSGSPAIRHRLLTQSRPPHHTRSCVSPKEPSMLAHQTSINFVVPPSYREIVVPALKYSVIFSGPATRNRPTD